jgi:hypothetical protein
MTGTDARPEGIRTSSCLGDSWLSWRNAIKHERQRVSLPKDVAASEQPMRIEAALNGLHGVDLRR